MVSLNDILPKPTAEPETDRSKTDWWFKEHEDTLAVAIKEPPPYGKRAHWIPRGIDDFGDGGAFPEIHIAQHPLNMGRSKAGKNQDKTLALQMDSEGKLNFDAVVRHGHGKDKIIYTKLADQKEKLVDYDDDDLQRPSEDDVQDITEKTRDALSAITKCKIESAMPVKRAEKQAPAQFIRYTPSQQGASYNSGAQQRIIRMVEAQKDPMEPPRFQINQKIPRAPPSPPAPVMHSPSRKVSAKEQAEWKIPPCISNWKNNKGFTIPLDKRLAADGRGLQQVHINENFAKLAESLYIADRKAREQVEARSQLERRLAQKEKEEKEERMRAMARKAREERAGIKAGKVDEDVKERDEFRRDRAEERKREKNLSRMNPERRAKMGGRERERDISEKIALGLPDARHQQSGDTQFDQRLFNTTKGLDSGGGLDDETYSAYDKPWRNTEGVSSHIYRPSKNTDQDVYGGDLEQLVNTQRFVPDKGFAGSGESNRREGPVQFERSAQQSTIIGQHDAEEDPFGLGKFLDEAKRGHKRSQPSDSAGEKRRK